ncbi:RNA-directed DNA polymerase from mobile element jockey [Trichonephila inaurata madagascariensis]|uniref:RNA-directed DNA polymerase from mobile element jockey n=1 Tax=Trichonephila inaurata madagascariensis TaxID=2747483 RepID=A0A8X7C3X5_9ARAC|nr:RNA-directed DNA polymerase from mobile element jockey [Trichonephila inaurata madagascariensis]
MTVAELQRKVNLKASSNTILIPQHWCFKRKYSQDKSGIGELSRKLQDFIKRVGIMKERTFQVTINSICSRIGSIHAGSPQGSILSPLLYSLYTHDFPTTPTVEVCLFADDAAILTQSHSPDLVRKNLQKYLFKLKKWLMLWRISVNTSKSQAIIFKKGNFNNRLNPLKLFRSTIPWCDEVLYLGVTLDKKHRLHIEATYSKYQALLFLPALQTLPSRDLLADRFVFFSFQVTQTEKKRPPGVGALKIGSPLTQHLPARLCERLGVKPDP